MKFLHYIRYFSFQMRNYFFFQNLFIKIIFHKIDVETMKFGEKQELS